MVFVFALFILSVGFNLALFVPAYLLKTDKLTDISYSLTFIFLALYCFSSGPGSTLQKLLLTAVLVWAVRLGGFLLLRIFKMKRDKRFDGVRDNLKKFLGFWVLQGITVPIILLAAALAWRSAVGGVTAVTIVGAVIFAAGLLIEATADFQKFRFNAHNTTHTWIDNGLWRISRHPNYLGEISVWIGVYLIAFNALVGTSKIAGLASPLYIMCLLLLVSGIPPLEASADAKWGKDKNYRQYKKEVPVLVPTLASLKRLVK